MSRIAAEQQAPAQMGALRALLDLEKETPADAYVEASNSFHQLLAGLSGNPVLDLVGQSLRALYAERVFRGQATPEETQVLCHEAHPQIGEAILAGDGATAERLMAKHMADLNRLVNQRATWLLDERVAWEV